MLFLKFFKLNILLLLSVNSPRLVSPLSSLSLSPSPSLDILWEIIPSMMQGISSIFQDNLMMFSFDFLSSSSFCRQILQIFSSIYLNLQCQSQSFSWRTWFQISKHLDLFFYFQQSLLSSTISLQFTVFLYSRVYMWCRRSQGEYSERDADADSRDSTQDLEQEQEVQLDRRCCGEGRGWGLQETNFAVKKEGVLEEGWISPRGSLFILKIIMRQQNGFQMK